MGSRLSLIMSDDLEQIIRKMATEECRNPRQQIMHLVNLGLKYQGKPIKDSAVIPPEWQVIKGDMFSK